MRAVRYLLWVGGAIVISVTVAWALIQTERVGRREDIAGIERQIDRVHKDLKDDIREIREVLRSK